MPVHPGFTVRVDAFGNLVVTKEAAVNSRRPAHGLRARQPADARQGSTVDPILVEIVQGTLASVEMEVETAIARTSPLAR